MALHYCPSSVGLEVVAELERPVPLVLLVDEAPFALLATLSVSERLAMLCDCVGVDTVLVLEYEGVDEHILSPFYRHRGRRCLVNLNVLPTVTARKLLISSGFKYRTGTAKVRASASARSGLFPSLFFIWSFFSS